MAGARILRTRIDEHQRRHWAKSPAVRAGFQDVLDPDAEQLVGCGPRVRVYETRQGRRFHKELVGERWRTVPQSLERGTPHGE